MSSLLRVGRGGILGAVFLVWFSAAAPSRAAEPLGFGIQAVGRRSYFVFDAHGGDTVRGAVRIVSTTDRDHVVFLRTADAGTGVTGGLVYATRGSRPRGPGGWIRLARSKVELPANGAVEVPFTARIPRGAAAGDRLAGIVVSGRPPRAVPAGRRRFRLRFVSRLAIAVQFRVPGRLTRALRLRDTAIAVGPAGATVGLGLASTGNRLITRTTGEVTVFQRGQELFSEPLDIGAVVPGTDITYPVPWLGKPVEGEYEVRGTLRPEGAAPVRIDRTVRFDAGRIDRYRRQTGRPATDAGSTPLLITLVAILGSGLAGLGTGRARVLRRAREPLK